MSFGARHLQMVLVMLDPTSWAIEDLDAPAHELEPSGDEDSGPRLIRPR